MTILITYQLSKRKLSNYEQFDVEKINYLHDNPNYKPIRK